MVASRALFVCVGVLVLGGCRAQSSERAQGEPASAERVRRQVGVDPGGVGAGTPLQPKPGHELAAFAGGCFWGVEDVFRQVPGVTATAVGYTGGHTDAPTYSQVCEHGTGHAEAVLIEYDPSTLSYAQLLRVFFANHDPTTLNRQGPDIGDQYRSHVFSFSPAQADQAKQAIAAERESRGKELTTKLEPIGRFWIAEDYHQQYDEKTGTHSCPIPKGLPGTESL